VIFVKLQTDIIRFKKSYQNESVLCHVIYRVGRRFIQVVNHKALIIFLFGRYALYNILSEVMHCVVWFFLWSIMYFCCANMNGLLQNCNCNSDVFL